MGCPGLVNGVLPVRAFDPAMKELEESFKAKMIRSDSHPLRGCEENAEDIFAALEHGKGLRADKSPTEVGASHVAPKDVVVFCYSKGMPDFLTFLVKHPEWQSRI